MNYTLTLNNTDHVVILDEHDVIRKDSVLPLTLYGPHILFDYGEEFQNNFFYLLENYASSSHINSPAPGMLWLDSSGMNPMLKLYTDDYTWKRILFDYENILLLELSNGLPKYNHFIQGDELSIFATIEHDIILEPAQIKWYYLGELLTTGVASITVDQTGFYFATYTYTNSDNKRVVAQTPTRRVIEDVFINAGAVPSISLSQNYETNAITVELVYSDITPFSVEWEWFVDGVSLGSGNSNGISSAYIARQSGQYQVTAKYNDTNHIGDDKASISRTTLV